MYLEYHTVVVMCNFFSEKKDLVGCLADAQSLLRPEKKVLVLCLAGVRSLLQPEKKIQSSVWRVCDHYYDRKKKVLVVCLAGVRSLLRPEKKVLVVCLVGALSLLRPEKKSSSRLSGGCAIVITTGTKVLVVYLAGARLL